MPEHFVSFDCGGDTLAAILHEPGRDASDSGVLIIVGGPQYRVGSHRQFVLMARLLASAGYPVFRFDYRGMGDSDGAHRTFEAVDADIRAAIDEFAAQAPGIRGVVIFGLCDAASAALMYCHQRDPRVRGLVLANPWVRTESGEAKALVRHYYGRRLLQRSFWEKLWSGKHDLRHSLGNFVSNARRAAGASDGTAPQSQHFTRRMLAGLHLFRGRVLLLISGRDLTAREFDEFTGNTREWSAQLACMDVQRLNLPQADHTFSGAAALLEATQATARWLAGSRPA